jgi:hypothetical protein
MGSIPNKIKFAMAGALLVPCFGRFALHGTGHEHDYYRYLVPFFVGGLAGFLIGFMKDKKITQINMLTQDQVYEEMERARSEKRSHFIFKHCLSNGEVRDVEVFSGPINFRGKKLLCSIVHDITDRVIAETEREKLIKELQDALKEIKTLRGIIPICSHCKKVRNDTGAWDRLDEYIAKKSNAEFSHGICPECAKQLYPGYNI